MASPTVNRSRQAPAIVHDLTARSGKSSGAGTAKRTNGGARRKARTQWLVLGAALTVLAGMLVAWALSQAAGRVEVVTVARPVAAGSVLQADDLTTAAVAFDGASPGLVPATSISQLIGLAATIDLQPGSLLTAGMWSDASSLSADERTVGVVLEAGRHPDELAQGMSALALALDDDLAGVTVRVLGVESGAGAGPGSISVTLAVAEADATRVARLGATDRLVLIGLPAIAVADTGGVTPDGVPVDQQVGQQTDPAKS